MPQENVFFSRALSTLNAQPFPFPWVHNQSVVCNLSTWAVGWLCVAAFVICVTFQQWAWRERERRRKGVKWPPRRCHWSVVLCIVIHFQFHLFSELHFSAAFFRGKKNGTAKTKHQHKHGLSVGVPVLSFCFKFRFPQCSGAAAPKGVQVAAVFLRLFCLGKREIIFPCQLRANRKAASHWEMLKELLFPARFSLCVILFSATDAPLLPLKSLLRRTQGLFFVLLCVLCVHFH